MSPIKLYERFKSRSLRFTSEINAEESELAPFSPILLFPKSIDNSDLQANLMLKKMI